jgi:hypothetical protein
MLVSIGRLVPPPSDVLVTPFTFRVTNELPDFLSQFDGARELSGEWVETKQTYPHNKVVLYLQAVRPLVSSLASSSLTELKVHTSCLAQRHTGLFLFGCLDMPVYLVR